MKKNNNHNNPLSSASREYFQEEYKLPLDQLERTELEEQKITELVEIIKALPITEQNIILGRYGFDFSPEDVNIMYGVEDSKTELIRIHSFLSIRLGLKDSIISDTSLKEAAQKIIEAETLEAAYMPEETIKKKKRKFKIPKTAAIILISAAIAFSTALITSASFREMLFRILLVDHKEYSHVRVESTEEETQEVDVNTLKVGYVPERFVLDKIEDVGFLKDYVYLYNEEYLSITISSFETDFFIDTEDADVKEIEYGDGEAYMIEKEGHLTLFYIKDNMAVRVMGRLSIEEIYKIADNIK